jgi:hypothetical protein
MYLGLYNLAAKASLGTLLAATTNETQMDVNEVLKGGSDAMKNGGSLSAASGQVDQLGGGAYHIVYKAGIYIAVVMLVVSGIAIIFSNSQTREDGKKTFIWRVLGAILIFAAISLVVIAQKIGMNLLG